MQEVRNLLRYTLPGLATLLIAFGMLLPFRVDLAWWIRSGEVLGKFVSILVAAGALGYINAHLYFSFRWFGALKNYLVINHKDILQNLDSKIEVRGPTKPWEVKKLELEVFDSWAILNYYCVSRSEIEDYMKAITPQCERMVDVTHGLGSLCTGCTLLPVIIIPYLLIERPCSPYGAIVAVAVAWALLVVLLWFAFRRSLKSLQAVSNTAFIESIMEKYKRINKGNTNSQKEKVVIYYEKDPPENS